MLASYPIQLRLQGRAVLVVGAGGVAKRKLVRLIRCGAQVRVVAKDVSDAVRTLAAAHDLTLLERAFREDDARDAWLVIAATDDVVINAQVARCARARGALVLRVDAPEDSDFTLPACAQTEHLEATISTRGDAPAASRRLARELAGWLAQGPERFAAEVKRARHTLRSHSEAAVRLRGLSDGELFEACCARDEARIAEIMSSTLEAP